MSTLTPNYGLIVPEATDTVAQVRADYATNLGLIDNISGGGGGGNVYGAFINTDKVITSGSYTSTLSYTATEDCCFQFGVGGTVSGSGKVYLDGNLMQSIYVTSDNDYKDFIFLKKGQIVTLNSQQNVTFYYTVYGLIQGTESIFTPIIYSDNERMIGIWRDNKPLYQKSFSFTANVSSGQYVTIDTLTGYGDIISFDGWFKEANIYYGLNDIGARLKVEANGDLRFAAASNSSWYGDGYVTIQYTKSADVAGSGNWNTDGIPMVHYSSTEHVIGTWIDGKTVYERSFTHTLANSPDADSESFLVASGVTGIDTLIKMDGTVKSPTDYAFCPDSGLPSIIGWNYTFHLNPSGQIVVWTSASSQYYQYIAGGKATVTIQYTKSS